MTPDRSARRVLVGLTGGIASGKSLALREFARQGAQTLSLDGLAHELTQKGASGYRRIVASFGRAILDARGQIDRQVLAAIVFKNARRRRRLEGLTHPLILKEMRSRLKGSRSPVAVVDVPLLFEAGLSREFDVTVLLTAHRRRRLDRALRRGGLALADVRRRMGAQMTDAAKRPLADVVVENDGTRKDFLKKIRQYHRAFSLMAAPWEGSRPRGSKQAIGPRGAPEKED